MKSRNSLTFGKILKSGVAFSSFNYSRVESVHDFGNTHLYIEKYGKAKKEEIKKKKKEEMTMA